LPTSVNDVHSLLNETAVAKVVQVTSLDSIRDALAETEASRLPVAIAGGRHAMGGQQFCAGGLLLDTRRLDRVLAFDPDAGTIDVEAGIQWPALLDFLRRASEETGRPWAFRQKQTGADRLTIGGAVSANVHGRGLAFPPFGDEIESLTLVDAAGEVRTCSRQQNHELFRLVIGGYGLFGVVASVKLRLVPRRTLERIVEVRTLDGLAAAFEERARAGFLYGDFQFGIDPDDPEFLTRGVFSCYRPVPGDPSPPAGQRVLTTADWQALLLLTHVDKREAWARYSAHYLSTSGQLYESDAHQLSEYLDGYHAWLDQTTGAETPGSEMITEIYVPRGRLEDLLLEVADDFREHGVNVIYGTIRVVERDEESFLPWARDRWACVIFNLHVDHTQSGLAEARDAFRRLIDLAVARGGSYFLTYHRWARRDQVESCYPRMRDFLAAKLEHDPEERFQSDWYRHQVGLLR